MENKRAIGSKYEAMAAAYLETRGYEILEQNYRDRFGEIDIIARDGKFLVFLEVKYRKDLRMGHPLEAVDYRKQQRIRNTARRYLYCRYPNQVLPCRFDVVAILGQEIRLIQNAF